MITLKEGKESFLRARHPWIYRGAVQSAVPTEELAPVSTSRGETVAWGFYSPDSLIAVRVVSFGAERPAAGWAAERLRRAADLRAGLGLGHAAGFTGGAADGSGGWRLVNAEGDFLPGLVVDVYARTTVVRPLVRGMEAALGEVLPALREMLPDNRIFLKRDERAARIEKLQLPAGYLSGEGDGTETIEEGGVRLRVDIAQGQKTGFYLDQRDNRLLTRALARGRRVLNLFAYTGGFALQAAAGGAAACDSVESSRAALELAQESAALNPQPPAPALRWLQEDVFRFLENAPRGERYGLIVLDPPPFARRKSEVPGAIKGYRQLNRACLNRLEPGGLLLSFTCSGAVSGGDLLGVIREEALVLGRQARVLRGLQAAPDHPFSLVHPEGEYLKGWLIHVE